MNVKTIVSLVVAIIVVVVLTDTFYIVNERDRVLTLRFGAVSSADVEPGIHVKIPIAEEVKRFDGRILTLDSSPQRYYTVEKKPLIVDSFVKWRVGNVKKYYTATSGDELRANRLLTDRVNEGLRNQIGNRDMHEVISGARDELMQELTLDLNSVMSKATGIDVVDVRVKKIELPPEVSEAVFSRMKSEREIEAKQHRATGEELALGITADADRQSVVLAAEAYRDAEIIRGDGDAEAAQIYAAAYGQDPEFYRFYRSINAYVDTFDENSLMVIDPSSEFFQYLKKNRE